MGAKNHAVVMPDANKEQVLSASNLSSPSSFLTPLRFFLVSHLLWPRPSTES